MAANRDRPGGTDDPNPTDDGDGSTFRPDRCGPDDANPNDVWMQSLAVLFMQASVQFVH